MANVTSRVTAPVTVVGTKRQLILGEFVLGASGTVTSYSGHGIESVTKVAGTGQYDVAFGPAFIDGFGVVNLEDSAGVGQRAEGGPFTSSSKTWRVRGLAGGNGASANLSSCTVNFIFAGKVTNVPGG